MTTTEVASFSLERLPDQTAIADAAARHGIHLTQYRISSVEDFGHYFWDGTVRSETDPSVDSYTYIEDGLIFDIPTGEEPQAIEVHFTPDDDVTERNVSSATRYMLQGILSLQDYCLMAEAGYIRKPLTLTGKTNLTFARLITRLDFDLADEPDEEGKYEVSGSFEDVCNVALSPWAQELAQKLFNRLRKSDDPDCVRVVDDFKGYFPSSGNSV